MNTINIGKKKEGNDGDFLITEKPSDFDLPKTSDGGDPDSIDERLKIPKERFYKKTFKTTK